MTTCDPRVVRSRAAVIEATVALLGEVGHAGTTIDAVAERSGVAKTTIYRHWPSRARLLFDAFESLVEPHAAADTGDLRADLLTIGRGLAAKLADPTWSRMLVTLVDAAQSDPELAALAQEFTRNRRQAGRTVIELGIQRGELDPATDADLLIQLMGGTLFYRRLMLNETTGAAMVEHVVDAVLAGARLAPET